jgi:hypothetical protein
MPAAAISSATNHAADGSGDAMARLAELAGTAPGDRQHDGADASRRT